MSEHKMAKLPEISTRKAPLKSFTSLDTVVIVIRYTCTCGMTVITEDSGSSAWIINSPEKWTAVVERVTARGRELWDEHARG